MRAATNSARSSLGLSLIGCQLFFRGLTIHPLLSTSIVVFAIKLGLFVVDQTPLFFMGDSGVYIGSAIYGFIPQDRSFTYGLLIRWFAAWPGTLQPLIFAQVLASAATAWLLAFALLHFFGATPAIAVAASIVFALDPLQILHERLVLSEAFTLLFFAGSLLLALWYLRHPGLFKLLGVCLTGILIVSLRFVYIPIAIGEALLLPVLRCTIQPSREGDSIGAKKYLLHFLFVILVTSGLHLGYRQWVSALTGLPPAYQYMDGLFLASSWAPLLRPEDATETRTRNVLVRQTADPQFPLGARYLREAQLWSEGGLVDRLRRAFGGNSYAANESAKQMCLRALRRDPLGVARLAWLTHQDYKRNAAELRTRLLVEQGSDRPLSLTFIQELHSNFGLEAANSYVTMTLSKKIHLAGGAWYIYLLVSPLIWFLNVPILRPAHRSGVVLMGMVSLSLLLVTCAMATVSAYRYLHPLSFTGVMALGTLAAGILNRWRTTNFTDSCLGRC